MAKTLSVRLSDSHAKKLSDLVEAENNHLMSIGYDPRTTESSYIKLLISRQHNAYIATLPMKPAPAPKRDPLESDESYNLRAAPLGRIPFNATQPREAYASARKSKQENAK